MASGRRLGMTSCMALLICGLLGIAQANDSPDCTHDRADHIRDILTARRESLANQRCPISVNAAVASGAANTSPTGGNYIGQMYGNIGLAAQQQRQQCLAWQQERDERVTK